MVARDPADNPTEQFVPNFDDDEELDAEPAAAGDGEESAAPGTSAIEQDDDPEAGAAGSDGSGAAGTAGAEPEAGGESRTAGSEVAQVAADSEVVTAAIPGSGSTVSAGGDRSGRGGRPVLPRTVGLLSSWRRWALVGVLVLCTAAAGAFTGMAVVGAATDWNATWAGPQREPVRKPTARPSRSGSPQPTFRFPQPTQPPAGSPSASQQTVSPSATRTAKPPRTPAAPPSTPLGPIPSVTGSPPPSSVDPTPSASQNG